MFCLVAYALPCAASTVMCKPSGATGGQASCTVQVPKTICTPPQLALQPSLLPHHRLTGLCLSPLSSCSFCLLYVLRVCGSFRTHIHSPVYSIRTWLFRFINNTFEPSVRVIDIFSTNSLISDYNFSLIFEPSKRYSL
jgi:hypothetical protein